jgi:hypothetical protein
MGAWIYRSIFSWTRHQLEVRGQLHASAALPPGKKPPPPRTNWTGGWVGLWVGLTDMERWKYYILSLLKTKQTPWSESASKLYRPSDRRLSAKLLPTCADKGCHVVSVTDPYGRILDFLDRSRYFFLSSSSSIVLKRLSGPRSTPTTCFPFFSPQKIW